MENQFEAELSNFLLWIFWRVRSRIIVQTCFFERWGRFILIAVWCFELDELNDVVLTGYCIFCPKKANHDIFYIPENRTYPFSGAWYGLRLLILLLLIRYKYCFDFATRFRFCSQFSKRATRWSFSYLYDFSLLPLRTMSLTFIRFSSELACFGLPGRAASFVLVLPYLNSVLLFICSKWGWRVA